MSEEIKEKYLKLLHEAVDPAKNPEMVDLKAQLAFIGVLEEDLRHLREGIEGELADQEREAAAAKNPT